MCYAVFICYPANTCTGSTSSFSHIYIIVAGHNLIFQYPNNPGRPLRQPEGKSARTSNSNMYWYHYSDNNKATLWIFLPGKRLDRSVVTSLATGINVRNSVRQFLTGVRVSILYLFWELIFELISWARLKPLQPWNQNLLSLHA